MTLLTRNSRASRPLPRRRFLRGVGGALVALPVLSTDRLARAEPGVTRDGFPRRLVVFYTPNGTIASAFWPHGEGSAFALTGALPEILAPLAPFRHKMLTLRGLDITSSNAGPGAPHQKAMGHLLTGRPLLQGNFVSSTSRAGWASGISVDQEIARHVGAATRLPSLQLGVRADNSCGAEVLSRLSYAGPGQPLPPESRPAQAFARLFSDGNTEPEALRRTLARRSSVLDAVSGQFASLSRTVAAADRRRLEAHLAMVRDFERRLVRAPASPAVCRPPSGVPAIETPDSEEAMPAVAEAQVDLLAMTLVCDQTRVASLQISNEKNHIRYPWLDSLGEGHDLSHRVAEEGARREWITREVWHAQQLARLLSALDAVPEGDGTVLDHTAVLWCNALSTGTHSLKEIPFVLIGSAGGRFRTGRALSFDHRPHNDLLLSLLHAFDVPRRTFGDPRFCRGALPGLA